MIETSDKPRAERLRGHLPALGFAMIPLVALAIAIAIQAGGVPDMTAVTAVFDMASSALGSH
jgi:hypothetical protein